MTLYWFGELILYVYVFGVMNNAVAFVPESLRFFVVQLVCFLLLFKYIAHRSVHFCKVFGLMNTNSRAD